MAKKAILQTLHWKGVCIADGNWLYLAAPPWCCPEGRGVAQAVMVQVILCSVGNSLAWKQHLHQAAQSDFGLTLDDGKKLHAGTQSGNPNVGKRCIVYVLDTLSHS